MYFYVNGFAFSLTFWMIADIEYLLNGPRYRR